MIMHPFENFYLNCQRDIYSIILAYDVASLIHVARNLISLKNVSEEAFHLH